MNTDQKQSKPHTSAQDLERQVRDLFLTVDGNKFAKDSNSNKSRLEMYCALHTQRYDKPLAPMFNVVLNEHKPSTNRPHTSAQDLERQARNVFLTVDGNKFAKDSNSNK